MAHGASAIDELMEEGFVRIVHCVTLLDRYLDKHPESGFVRIVHCVTPVPERTGYRSVNRNESVPYPAAVWIEPDTGSDAPLAAPVLR